MIWQLCEGPSVIVFDESMADKLADYLEEKENLFCLHILRTIEFFDEIPSLAREETREKLRLNQAMEEFSRKFSRIIHSPKSSFKADDWQHLTNSINDNLWDYTELLEGCVVELFQQISQIGFEKWNVDFVHAVTTMRDELTHHMEDLLWAIVRLEKQLKVFRKTCETRNGKWGAWHRNLFPWQSLIDKALVGTIKRCNKFLNFRYRKFIERYTGYLQLCEVAQQSRRELSKCRVFATIDTDQQDKFKELDFLLNLWTLNNSARVLYRDEIIRALRKCAGYDVLYPLFNDYFLSVKKALFDKSRMIKKLSRLLFMDLQVRKPLLDTIEGLRSELKILRGKIVQYKKFYRETSPQKVRFWARIFGSQKNRRDDKHIRKLQELTCSIDELDLLAINFHASMESNPAMERKLTRELLDEVNRNLHEITQPLASKDLMQRDVKSLLAALQGLDEMGSFDPNIVVFVRQTLIKAMCADWRYRVLQQHPLFHHLYAMHRSIVHIREERQHMIRLNKFETTLKQLKTWIENNETVKRGKEIELDINDIKVYFQDFYAQVCRLTDLSGDGIERELDEDNFTVLSEALLQYLYLFGKFFSSLKLNNSEDRLIRNQLLFVDQYFEEIERKLDSKL